MDCIFKPTLAFRSFLAAKLEEVDEEKFDICPEGSSNTIRWQLAHLIVTPSLLTYRLVGVENPMLNDEFIESSRKGTCHDDFSLNEDYGKKHLLEYFVETVKQLKRDYQNLSKHEYKAYETSSGFVLKDLDSALAYSAIHDGIHIGQISKLLKSIG